MCHVAFWFSMSILETNRRHAVCYDVIHNGEAFADHRPSLIPYLGTSTRAKILVMAVSAFSPSISASGLRMIRWR
jgi:hypothetical protein